MYHCISNLISGVTDLKIVGESQKYTVQGKPMDELLLKSLM